MNLKYNMKLKVWLNGPYPPCILKSNQINKRLNPTSIDSCMLANVLRSLVSVMVPWNWSRWNDFQQSQAIITICLNWLKKCTILSFNHLCSLTFVINTKKGKNCSILDTLLACCIPINCLLLSINLLCIVNKKIHDHVLFNNILT